MFAHNKFHCRFLFKNQLSIVFLITYYVLLLFKELPLCRKASFWGLFFFNIMIDIVKSFFDITKNSLGSRFIV
jgi:hypothetical protein